MELKTEILSVSIRRGQLSVLINLSQNRMGDSFLQKKREDSLGNDLHSRSWTDM